MEHGDFHLWMAIAYLVMIVLVILGIGTFYVCRVLRSMCDDADDH